MKKENKKKFIKRLKYIIRNDLYNTIHNKKEFTITIIVGILAIISIVSYPIYLIIYLSIFLLIWPICFLIVYLPIAKEYNHSLYKKVNKIEYLDLIFDIGRLGEWEIYRKITKIKGYNKILVNLYIPKDGEETAEIDLIFIHKTGIYVFESKNVGGYIFGKEKDNRWTQCLAKNKRYQFNNPIRQNRNHIKALLKILPFVDINAYKSYIVFSERCVLKKIVRNSPNVRVINRDILINTLQEDFEKSQFSFSENQINKIYYNLVEYMECNNEEKEKHIQTIRKKYIL